MCNLKFRSQKASVYASVHRIIKAFWYIALVILLNIYAHVLTIRIAMPHYQKVFSKLSSSEFNKLNLNSLLQVQTVETLEHMVDRLYEGECTIITVDNEVQPDLAVWADGWAKNGLTELADKLRCITLNKNCNTFQIQHSVILLSVTSL